jgi:ABC-2 type transport system permease protein
MKNRVNPDGSVKHGRIMNPFWVIVNKEISDHIKSWRFLILISLIALTCLGSMYSALTNISEAIKESDPEDVYLFLKLYTLSNGTLPSFFVFISFLGPLLGIGMGFDAVNSEQNRGTLSRILSQPVPRDFFINAKFTASLIVISTMFFLLSFLVMGIGLISIGIPPTPEEFIRIIIFTLLAIIYVAFWLNLSILFSIRFQHPATSALSGIAIWLFFSIFYEMLVDVVFEIIVPDGMNLSTAGERLRFGILRVAPNQMFSDITTSILTPSVRSVGPLTMEQISGAIPGHLPVGQSVLLVWPYIVVMIAITLICFMFSYILFMKREIK